MIGDITLETIARILFSPVTVAFVIIGSIFLFVWFSLRLAKRDREQADVMRQSMKIYIPGNESEEIERLNQLEFSEEEIQELEKRFREALKDKGYSISTINNKDDHGTGTPRERRSGGAEDSDES